MKDVEITAVKCSGCGCAIVPELHEAVSGEYEMSFFICPYCKKRYVITITDAELRKNIEEYCTLRQANEKDLLTDEEKQRMVWLRAENRKRAKALKEALGYGDS